MAFMVKEPTELEESINYNFNDKELLKLALTHGSSLQEGEGFGNERLEFVGDAVLDLIIARALFELYPERDEGWMTQMKAGLVEKRSLFKKAMSLGLGEYLILGKGEDEGRGRFKSSILSGAYEALIGAMFIDGGYAVCESFLKNEFGSFLVVDEDYNPKNAKSLLQEKAQKGLGSLPRYEVVSEDGPDHKRTFVVAVFVDGVEKARGEGRSKKEAEMAAATSAIEQLE